MPFTEDLCICQGLLGMVHPPRTKTIAPLTIAADRTQLPFHRGVWYPNTQVPYIHGISQRALISLIRMVLTIDFLPIRGTSRRQVHRVIVQCLLGISTQTLMPAVQPQTTGIVCPRQLLLTGKTTATRGWDHIGVTGTPQLRLLWTTDAILHRQPGLQERDQTISPEVCPVGNGALCKIDRLRRHIELRICSVVLLVVPVLFDLLVL